MAAEKVNSPERIKAHVAKFSSADDARAWREVAETVVGLVVFTGLWLHFWESPLPWFIFTVLTALTWTRVFIIFHDCAHYSFFSTPAANHRMALVTGAWAVTPYVRLAPEREGARALSFTSFLLDLFTFLNIIIHAVSLSSVIVNIATFLNGIIHSVSPSSSS